MMRGNTDDIIYSLNSLVAAATIASNNHFGSDVAGMRRQCRVQRLKRRGSWRAVRQLHFFHS